MMMMMGMMMNEHGELCQCLCHNDSSINVVLSAQSIISRSYCYTIWSAIGIILSSVCPSVCLLVCL